MKLLFASIIILLISGCHWNTCQYCRHDREPDYESNKGEDMKDGYRREVQTRIWVEYIKEDR